ncbi:MAG TPA: endonuclease/exonuclease/phosphatase family protein, partial [Sumerlaeia bacterium]|nr:endonuclease/exonuclease/phosphatase family protein [Sumerlaeia bacterium]
VLSYNVAGKFLLDPPTTAPLRRVLAAIDPDAIAFQEIRHDLGDGDPEAAAGLIGGALDAILPPGPWSVWVGQSDGHNRNALASRFPLSMPVRDTTPASDIRGVTAALVDLPNPRFGETDLYVMNVHMKAEDSATTPSSDARRQKHADAIISWMRDARIPACTSCPDGDQIDLPSGTPMLVVGDFNLYTPASADRAPYHPTRTLIEGDVFDEETFGPHAPPDWDGSPATDAAPWDYADGNPATYPSTGAPRDRLDRFIYTDSVLRVANRAILNALNLSTSTLAALGLEAADTGTATSDHLPVFVDLELGAEPVPGRLLINEFLYNDEGTDDRNFLELINVGGRPVNLDAPADYHLLRSDSGLPTDAPTTETEASRYDLNGVVPPGGVFVLYNSAGQSKGIAARIEANLPDPLQRHDQRYDRSFLLANSSNRGIALIATEDNATDQLIEAYMYEDSADDGNHFFLTRRNLLIQLAAPQRCSLRVAGDDRSFLRRPPDASPDTFAHWTLLGAETAGRINHPNPPKNVWIVH